ncbi:glycosyl transferase [Brucella pseudogrignonensis]|uniref:Glycosyltransferase involved in cell wall biosynthesis n=1 Tax=Brucella pseudogrignonensis TaxID=419475 RepID=A0ABU1M6I1_9HYPH|nr:glycosyl transferase [Brucella pseudogrignonensis]MDR6431650.1 glycosyltransferase involved in cell wall biosynthesis [Brucella pseudogrignonensis]
MLSVLLVTNNSEKALAHTLAGLVPAVVDGLLRRVVVVDQGSTDDTKLVAEGAGCALYDEENLSEAFRDLRTHWLLILQPGATLQDEWIDAVGRHLAASNSAARFTLPQEARFGLLGKLFTRKPSLDAGLLVKVDKLKPLPSRLDELEDLPRQLKPVRLSPVITLPNTTKGGA